MGCGGSKAEEPIKIEYHPMNDVLPSAPETDQIYEILEFWFCTTYTEFDRTNHIKPLGELTQPLERKDDATSQQAVMPPPEEPGDVKGVVNPGGADELQKILQQTLKIPDG